MENNEIEVRTARPEVCAMTIREGKGESRTIVGYASTFDDSYPVDMVMETIDKSAFTRTLKEKPDVFALLGHDTNRILGRTKNGTLSLMCDDRGLRCEIVPILTNDARDTLALISAGCLDSMSFGFKVQEQSFEYREGQINRRVLDMDLHEVSVVAFPANKNAVLSLRAKSMAMAEMPNEVSLQSWTEEMMQLDLDIREAEADLLERVAIERKLIGLDVEALSEMKRALKKNA